MFKKNFSFLSIGVLFLLLLVPIFVHAQYEPLAEGLRGLETENLGAFFNNLFEIALTLGAVIAVLIIAVSGLQYMTTEAATDKTQSKERIQQAVLGLLMLLSVWLFFSEIDPSILNLDFTLSEVSVTSSSSDSNGPNSQQNSQTQPGTVNVPIPGTSTQGVMHCALSRGESHCFVNETECQYLFPRTGECVPRPEGIRLTDQNIRWYGQ